MVSAATNEVDCHLDVASGLVEYHVGALILAKLYSFNMCTDVLAMG